MENQYKTVVQGEASESDEEDQEEAFDHRHNEAPQSVVIEGEASESEEEELDTTEGRTKRGEVPPLKLSEHSSSFESIDEIAGVPVLNVRQSSRPKYDTVLHRKLWESNLSLCNNLNGLVSQAYLSAAKEISNCGQQLSKSHTSIQDVSHNMRLMTNDLFNLQDKIDIIASCKLLPNIILPRKQPEAVAEIPCPTTTTTVPPSLPTASAEDA